ncbi:MULTISPECIES: hypothetical protein [unclassified Rhodanobacter]|uniref:hypothetical protein n=1 Tax=unclassified Rhodanobacter TaxID=2621553 RepID=UPI0007A9FB70|nr:hypothetical protein [Rhodanobacter sp. FW510-R10]KZC32610.1 hypothetical protein RhoFW510R10_11895 [Rhodanobacter sp. FW510-R10]
MTDVTTQEPSFHQDYPQLPGLDGPLQPSAPAGVELTAEDAAALGQLSEILTHIRYLATARPDGAFAQIEILAVAMAKTPRLLAEGAPFGARRTLEQERLAGERALAMATAPDARSVRCLDRVLAEQFGRNKRHA